MRHQQLLDDYLSYVDLTRTTSTVSCYRDKLNPLFKFWKDLELQDFTRAEFERYLAHGKNKRGWKPRTMVLYIDACRGFLRWAEEREMGIPDFAKGIKKPRVYVGKVNLLSATHSDTVPGPAFIGSVVGDDGLGSWQAVTGSGGANREFLSLPPGGGPPAWSASVPVADVSPAGGVGQDVVPVGATVAATAPPAVGWSSTGPYATMLNLMMPLPVGAWFEKL